LIMKYSEAISFLSRLERFGIKLGLTRIKQLLADLGNPQQKLKVIHIAGTNGKGSVAAMVAYILQAAGFQVGLFTSPHLLDWRERFAIFESNGISFIAKKEFSLCFQKIKPIINRFKKQKNSPTVFEVLTALAFDYFAKKQLDFAIMEVGLGGRLDATNVGKPLVSVITNIGLEHKEYLGDTLEMIAGEKAGIIKKRGIVVTAEGAPVPLKIIKKKCKIKSAKLIQIGKDIKINSYRLFKKELASSEIIPSLNRKGKKLHFKGKTLTKFITSLSVKGLRGNYPNLELSLPGKHQAVNAATAIGTVECLIFSGIEISSQVIRSGLKSVYWPARFELISTRPTVLLDGAHNPGGAYAAARTIKEIDSYRELLVIFGCLKDKDYEGMLKRLLPLVSQIIITKPHSDRSLDPFIIAQAIKKYGVPFFVREKIKEALKFTLKKAKADDVVFIAGSLYLAGEVKRYLIQSMGKRCD